MCHVGHSWRNPNTIRKLLPMVSNINTGQVIGACLFCDALRQCQAPMSEATGSLRPMASVFCNRYWDCTVCARCGLACSWGGRTMPARFDPWERPVRPTPVRRRRRNPPGIAQAKGPRGQSSTLESDALCLLGIVHRRGSSSQVNGQRGDGCLHPSPLFAFQTGTHDQERHTDD